MSVSQKIFTGAIIIILVIGGFFLVRTRNTKVSSVVETNHPTSSALSVAPLVTEKYDHTEASKSYTFEASYPESSATHYPEMYAFIQSAKKSFIDDFNSISASDAQAFDLKDRPYSFVLTTRIATSTNTVSYILEVYVFEGGAHGEQTDTTFTYDTKGTLVTLDHVFNAAYLASVSSLARKHFYSTLVAREDSDTTSVDLGTEPKPENYSSWYMTPDTITFIFQEYAIGPYVLGLQEFKLKKSDVSDILSPEFK